jgi:hypothetical protein
METQTSERCHFANEELRDFLRQAENLASETTTIREEDVCELSMHLISRAPEIGDASRGETLDAGLRMEIGEYVKNLRALQTTLEMVHSAVIARKLRMEKAKRRLGAFPEWPSAHYQTT